MRTSKLRLLVELRRLLARPDTRVIEKKLKVCGHSTWEAEDDAAPNKITIYLDPRRDGRVRLVIHELLHIWWDFNHVQCPMLTYELEEAAVLAWESKLYAWLHDPRRIDALESWNKAIERKMR